MKISNMDVGAIFAKVKQQLNDDTAVSPSLRSAIELLIVLIQVLTGRLNTNSANSSTPPSQDPNRPRKSRSKGERKPGGQPGRIGSVWRRRNRNVRLRRKANGRASAVDSNARGPATCWSD